MRRYVSKSELWDAWDGAEPVHSPSITVFEVDDGPRPTGLLDAHGNQIFAIEEREPMGFANPTRARG